MPGNQEALRIDMSPNAAIRDYLSGSKPRMHSFEAVSWISCSRFKHCAMVRQAAIDFNCASWAKVLPSAWTSETTQATALSSTSTWTPNDESIVEHIAGIEDYQVALATFRAAYERWPGAPITLRQGARVIEDSRRLRTV